MGFAVDWECPVCGTAQWTEVDPRVDSDTLYQDCGLCCRPVVLRVDREDDGELRVTIQDR